MKFGSEEEAWEYWTEAYYLSGGDIADLDAQSSLFYDWVIDRGVTWDEEYSEIY